MKTGKDVVYYGIRIFLSTGEGCWYKDKFNTPGLTADPTQAKVFLTPASASRYIVKMREFAPGLSQFKMQVLPLNEVLQ